jgi:hypothetical protein
VKVTLHTFYLPLKNLWLQKFVNLNCSKDIWNITHIFLKFSVVALAFARATVLVTQKTKWSIMPANELTKEQFIVQRGAIPQS